MHEIAHRQGTVPVLDSDCVVGVITAGDLTRYADQHPGFLSHSVERAMNRAPKTIEANLTYYNAIYRGTPARLRGAPDDDCLDQIGDVVSQAVAQEVEAGLLGRQVGNVGQVGVTAFSPAHPFLYEANRQA